MESTVTAQRPDLFKHMPVLNLMPANMFEAGWNKGNKRLGYVWNAPKTSVWNIPQVNRLIGTR